MRSLTASIAIAIATTLGLSIPVFAQSVADAELEAFLDLAPGTLDGLGNGDATVGSALKQTFSGVEGQTLTFDWNFLTNESTPDDTFNDFSFISLSPSGTSTLADTRSRFPLLGNNVSFNDETGFNTFSLLLPETGTYTLGLGVVDVADQIVDSALLIDNVNLGTNGSFETGDFSDWETIGLAEITDASFGTGPTDGESQALLTTPEPSTFLGTGIVLGLGALLKRRMRRSTKETAEA